MCSLNIDCISLSSCVTTAYLDTYFITAVCRVQATSGEKPPGLWGHSLTMIDTHRALLFGGLDGWRRHNDAYLLDLVTWVSNYSILFYVRIVVC